MGKERRKFIRPESLNLLDYQVIDDRGRQGEYAMGRTLNVSEGGILMETRTALTANWKVMITLGLQEDLVEILGRIIRSAPHADVFQNGIEFTNMTDDKREILQRYIEAFKTHFEEDPGV